MNNRRDFLKSAGRYGALGGLGVLAALLARRGGVDREQHRCVNRSVCCGCPKARGCILPAGLSVRRARGDGA